MHPRPFSADQPIQRGRPERIYRAWQITTATGEHVPIEALERGNAQAAKGCNSHPPVPLQ
jgi:hypothetical protein